MAIRKNRIDSIFYATKRKQRPIAIVNREPTNDMLPFICLFTTMASGTAWRDVDLINTIQEYPCLFNIKLKEFKHVQMTACAWKKVAETTESTGTSVYCALYMRIFVKVGLWG